MSFHCYHGNFSDGVFYLKTRRVKVMTPAPMTLTTAYNLRTWLKAISYDLKGLLAINSTVC